MANDFGYIIPLRLLLTRSPRHLVKTLLGRKSQHTLHRKLLPILLERSSRDTIRRNIRKQLSKFFKSIMFLYRQTDCVHFIIQCVSLLLQFLCFARFIPLLSSILVSLALYLINHKHTVTLAVGSLAKAHPRNRTAITGIAKVNLITRVVWLNSWNYKSNFAFVFKSLGSIVKTSRVNSVNAE